MHRAESPSSFIANLNQVLNLNLQLKTNLYGAVAVKSEDADAPDGGTSRRGSQTGYGPGYGEMKLF